MRNKFQSLCMSQRMKIEHAALELFGWLCYFINGDLADALRTEGHRILDRTIAHMKWPPFNKRDFLHNGELLREMAKEFYNLGLMCQFNEEE